MALTIRSQLRSSLGELSQIVHTGDLSGPAAVCGAKDIYRGKSRKRITEMEGDVSANDVECCQLPLKKIALKPCIFPLTYRDPLETVKNILYFSQFRLNESIGISSMASQDYALPVFVYTWLGCREEPQDLFNAVGGNTLEATGVYLVRYEFNFFRAKISTIYRATAEKCKNSLILNLSPALSMSQLRYEGGILVRTIYHACKETGEPQHIYT
ncbi:hypothetical protein DV515_00004378, partial [Chloebia gouldiae]